MIKASQILSLITIILISCNQSTQENNDYKPISKNQKVLKSENIKPKASSEVDFDIIKPFKHVENESMFESDDIKLISKTDNSFMLTKKDFAIDDIDLSDSNYEGPGYNITLFKSKQNKELEIVILEATADIGTDWYYVIILNNESLVDKFYIKEPRADSENTNIGDFIKISLKKDILSLKFRKDKVARYSKNTENFKSDDQYFYLTRKLK